MPELFLIPIINVFDVHDVAVRGWLNELDDESLRSRLESPYGLERFFPEDARHAIKGVDDVHSEVIRLLDAIDPGAVLLDISIELVELENRYNKRLLSPVEFWQEYYLAGAGAEGSLQTVYCIYIKGIIEKLTRLIENKEQLPSSVVFYGVDGRTREELIPVYEDALDKDGEFVLQLAHEVNDFANLRESPGQLWYSSMAQRHAAVSYEETEKFYTELTNRIKRLLSFKVREHFVKKLKVKAQEFLSAYEKFLDYKIREDEIKHSNILEGLEILSAQSEAGKIVIFCGPMHYRALFKSLKEDKRLREMGITPEDIDITKLLNVMKPFTRKNRIMQSDYDIALDITGRSKPPRFDGPGAIIVP